MKMLQSAAVEPISATAVVYAADDETDCDLLSTDGSNDFKESTSNR